MKSVSPPDPNPRQIAALRERRGWTQEKLAERSGLSVRTIRNLEIGAVQNPRRSSVDLLAHALGVEVEEEQEYQPAAKILDRALWRGPQPPTSAIVGWQSPNGPRRAWSERAKEPPCPRTGSGDIRSRSSSTST